MKWQCVEYVNRYYYIIYGLNIRIAGRDAYQYYGNPSSPELVSYPDGGVTAPQVGDILCFSGGSAGHVAIVRNVGSTSITVIQQNVRENSDDANYTFPLTGSGGTFKVDGTQLGTGYSCQGWLRKKPTTSVQQSSLIAPSTFSLSQNFPNPFNPSTIISYQIASLGNVSLNVYDLLGREVATLVNEVKSPGSYIATFDAAHLPSGVYFCRLQTSSFTETKRIVLLK